MKDELCSLELSTLLKEIGFDEKVYDYFASHHTEKNCSPKMFWNTKFKGEFYVARPTQSLVARWLREKHGVHVEPTSATYIIYDYMILTWKGEDCYFIHDLGSGEFFESFELALEAGLLQACLYVKELKGKKI